MKQAALQGNADVVKMLIESGVDPNTRGDCGRWTLLHVSAGQGHGRLVELLLSARADPECRDADGRTPLEWADQAGHSNVVTVIRQRMCLSALERMRLKEGCWDGAPMSSDSTTFSSADSGIEFVGKVPRPLWTTSRGRFTETQERLVDELVAARQIADERGAELVEERRSLEAHEFELRSLRREVSEARKGGQANVLGELGAARNAADKNRAELAETLRRCEMCVSEIHSLRTDLSETRKSGQESEAVLRTHLAEKEAVILDIFAHVESLETTAKSVEESDAALRAQLAEKASAIVDLQAQNKKLNAFVEEALEESRQANARAAASARCWGR